MGKNYSLILSKRFVYPLIGTLLIILIVFVSYAISLGNEMATRFLPTLFGLMFSFLFFTVLFDLREYLEWKGVEDRIKKRIGNLLSAILWDVDSLVGAKTDYGDIKDEYEVVREKQLNALLTKFKLVIVPKTPERITELMNQFGAKETFIDEIIGRYGKF